MSWTNMAAHEQAEDDFEELDRFGVTFDEAASAMEAACGVSYSPAVEQSSASMLLPAPHPELAEMVAAGTAELVETRCVNLWKYADGRVTSCGAPVVQFVPTLDPFGRPDIEPGGSFGVCDQCASVEPF